MEALNTAMNNSENTMASSALNHIVNLVRETNVASSIHAGFCRYLRNATMRYNQVRTLVSGTAVRSIIAPDGIYVKSNIAVKRNNNSVICSVDSLIDMMEKHNLEDHLLILGDAGTGKSMTMRYIFLTLAQAGNYIPILLELRNISKFQKGSISILSMICDNMETYDADIPISFWEKTLPSGKYFFLLDGLDEVRESLFADVIQEINSFFNKYPTNPCVLTSRLLQFPASFESFTMAEIMPLNLNQSIELAQKFWQKDEKTIQFCRLLEEGAFETHRSFAENPLLLSLLFLTFMRNSSIPPHLAEFCNRAYEAIYHIHDTNDKGYFLRAFRCRLDEKTFKMLFARFCFQTYFQEKYEFTRDEIIELLSKSISMLKLGDVDPKDYLYDLMTVCLLVQDGLLLRFSHRTFQDYFAAYYTSVLTDDNQKRLFQHLLYTETASFHGVGYWEMLCQIEPAIFATCGLKSGLKDIQSNADSAESTDAGNLIILKIATGNCILYTNGHLCDNILNIYRAQRGLGANNSTLILGLFAEYYVHPAMSTVASAHDEHIVETILSKVVQTTDSTGTLSLSMQSIDSSSQLSENERQELYGALCRIYSIRQLRLALQKWLEEQEIRNRPSFSSFFDDF